MSDLSFNDILTNVSDTIPLIGDNWLQGRTVFGGLAAAMAAEHMQVRIKNQRPMRSFMVSFAAPTPSKNLNIQTTLLREGKNVSSATTSISGEDGQICLHAMGAFGRDRETHGHIDHEIDFKGEERTSVPPMPEINEQMLQMGMPPFLNNFALHWTGGGIPLSGTKSRRVGMWVKHKVPPQSSPVAALLAFSDIPPAAVMSHYTKPMRLSSLTWSVDFITPPCDLDASGWFYLDYRADQAINGYSQQSGTIYKEDGTLVALSRQCMCYFD